MRFALILASSLLLIAVTAVYLRPSHDFHSSISLISLEQQRQIHPPLFSKLGSVSNHHQEDAQDSSSSFSAAALFSKPNDVHASSMLVKVDPGKSLSLSPIRRAVTPAAQSTPLSAHQVLRAASELARSRAESLYPSDPAAKPDKFSGVKDWLIETIPQVRCGLVCAL
jgi:hypothetical protein